MKEPEVRTDFLPTAGRFFLGAAVGTLALWLLFDELPPSFYGITALCMGIASAILGRPLYEALWRAFRTLWNIT